MSWEVGAHLGAVPASLCWYGGHSARGCHRHVAPVWNPDQGPANDTHGHNFEPNPWSKRLHHLHCTTSHDYPVASGDPTPSGKDNLFLPKSRSATWSCVIPRHRVPWGSWFPSPLPPQQALLSLVVAPVLPHELDAKSGTFSVLVCHFPSLFIWNDNSSGQESNDPDTSFQMSFVQSN